MTVTLLLLAPIGVPLLGALTSALGRWWRATLWSAAVSAAVILAAGIALAGVGVGSGAGGLLRVDPLSAFMLIVIGAVALLAAAAGPDHLRAEILAGRATERTVRRYGTLVQAFLAAMALAVLAADLGVLWVAVEATTVVTAFLVGQRRTRTALEAAWKYVVICSAGIALAFLGTVLLNYASRHTGGHAGLDWVALTAGAPDLDPGVTRLAVALLVIGFGTKAGLAPLHAWLPDAHSQAPAPVSALMSGVLLAVAFYAILRVKVIADAALGPDFLRVLLIVMALATLLIAATLLLAQRDYKRMLAYSSIEHMGLLAVGAAAGSRLGAAAVLLHILGHGLTKAVLFVGAGRILQSIGTSRIADVRGLAASQPLLAGCFAAGVLALVGFPPFSLFASELGLIRAGFSSGLGLVTVAVLVLMLVIAAALFAHTSRMVLGGGHPADRLPMATSIVMVAGLAACALAGVTAGPLDQLLERAAEIVAVRP